MILGKRSDPALSALASSRLLLLKKLVAERSRKFFAELKIEKRKIGIGIAISVGNDHPIVVPIGIERREIDLTAVTVCELLVLVEAPSPMHMKLIVERLLLSAKRITVSQVWLKVCCLIVARWTRTETGRSVNETGIVNMIGTENEIVIETARETESETENGTGTESTHPEQDARNLPVITIGKGVIARKSVRECIDAAWKEAQ